MVNCDWPLAFDGQIRLAIDHLIADWLNSSPCHCWLVIHRLVSSLIGRTLTNRLADWSATDWSARRLVGFTCSSPRIFDLINSMFPLTGHYTYHYYSIGICIYSKPSYYGNKTNLFHFIDDRFPASSLWPLFQSKRMSMTFRHLNGAPQKSFGIGRGRRGPKLYWSSLLRDTIFAIRLHNPFGPRPPLDPSLSGDPRLYLYVGASALCQVTWFNYGAPEGTTHLGPSRQWLIA